MRTAACTTVCMEDNGTVHHCSLCLPSHTLHYITLHYNHTISHNRHNDCQVSSDSKYYHNGWMGFPDENIQITSDLWITYEEKYIIVIQPEDGSLAHSQLPTEQRVRGEGHLPPLHCGRPEHRSRNEVLDCFMLQTCCCFYTSLWILNIDLLNLGFLNSSPLPWALDCWKSSWIMWLYLGCCSSASSVNDFYSF